MAKKRTYQDDDGRTIADMSGVGPSPMLFPRMPKKATPQDPPMTGPGSPRSSLRRSSAAPPWAVR